MPSRVARAATGALALTACLGLGLGSAIAAPSPAPTPAPLPTVQGVPVLAQVWVGNGVGKPEAVLTVHGVRRVEGGTVIYYSMGMPAGTTLTESVYVDAYGGGFFNTLSQAPIATGIAQQAAVIDLAGGKAYTALRTSDSRRCICTKTLDFSIPADKASSALVAFTVVAPVPSTVTTANLLVGTQIVPNVPVQDGLLEPVSDQPAPAVGTGWPKVPVETIATAIEPAKAVFPLRTRIEDLKSKVSTGDTATGTELSIDASVLFAVDKATLTPTAKTVIAKTAQQIKNATTTGTITVTGHTDSTANDAYNLELSTRRAAAVTAALTPLLPASITLKAVGKGETEPIANNGTPQGRQLNRRVTISLPRK